MLVFRRERWNQLIRKADEDIKAVRAMAVLEYSPWSGELEAQRYQCSTSSGEREEIFNAVLVGIMKTLGCY